MHVLEIVSMLLLVSLSMIVRLPHRHDNCICKYKLPSRAFFDISGKAAISPLASPPPGSRWGRPRATARRPKARRGPGPARDRPGAFLHESSIHRHYLVALRGLRHAVSARRRGGLTG